MTPQGLTLEQQFTLQSFNTMADQMSREQAIGLLKVLHEQLLVQKITYLELLKYEWNIDGEPNTGKPRGTGEQ